MLVVGGGVLLVVELGEETDLNFEKAEGDFGDDVDETYATYRKLASKFSKENDEI